MKQFKFLMPLAVGVSMTALLFSCNSGEEKKQMNLLKIPLQLKHLNLLPR